MKHLFSFVVDLPDDTDNFVDYIQFARTAIGDGTADLYDDNAFYDDDDD